VSQIIEGQTIGRTHQAARQPAPNHEDVLLAGLAKIAVVLLVNAMEFQKLVIVIGEPIELGVMERGRDGAGEGGWVCLSPSLRDSLTGAADSIISNLPILVMSGMA
jgi:hypothetical protein